MRVQAPPGGAIQRKAVEKLFLRFPKHNPMNCMGGRGALEGANYAQHSLFQLFVRYAGFRKNFWSQNSGIDRRSFFGGKGKRY
jgi:hypothetical protein